MAINYATKYPGRSNPADFDYPTGSCRDETAPGANNGTPVQQDTLNDIIGARDALLAEGEVAASGLVDTKNVSDQVEALKVLAHKNTVQPNLIIAPQNIEPITDGTLPPPDATPRAYTAGYEISKGWFVGTATTALTRNNGEYGVTSPTLGTLYTDVPANGNLEFLTAGEIIASVADKTGKPSVTGVTVNLLINPGFVRVIVDLAVVTVGVFTVKLEQNTKPSLHNVKTIDPATTSVITLVNALGTGAVNEVVNAQIPATLNVGVEITIVNAFPGASLINAHLELQFSDGKWRRVNNSQYQAGTGLRWGAGATVEDNTGVFIRGMNNHLCGETFHNQPSSLPVLTTAPCRVVIEKLA